MVQVINYVEFMQFHVNYEVRVLHFRPKNYCWLIFYHANEQHFRIKYTVKKESNNETEEYKKRNIRITVKRMKYLYIFLKSELVQFWTLLQRVCDSKLKAKKTEHCNYCKFVQGKTIKKKKCFDNWWSLKGIEFSVAFRILAHGQTK